MSKKNHDIMLQEKEKFISKSINNGYSKETSTKVFDLIYKFADYGFNKSHSVGYATVSYKMAYLKAHYPEYFMSHKRLLELPLKYIYSSLSNHKSLFVESLLPC